MITLKELEDAGYIRYKCSISQHAEFLMQKRVEDSNGTKYFISIDVYAAYPNQSPSTLNFEPHVQFVDNEPDDPFLRPTVNMTYLDDKNTMLQDVENFFERAWEFMGKPYYERNEY